MIDLNGWTAKELARLEKRVKKEYQTASVDLMIQSNRYFRMYAERWKAEYKKYQQGKYTDEQFKAWELSQLGRGEHWKELRTQMSNRLADAATIAAGYVNGKLPEIYAKNFNGVAEIAQESAMAEGVMGLRYDLVDEYTVRRLMMGSREVRPYKPIELDLPKYARFNKTKIQNALLQGILQGDSIYQIADRFQAVSNMNRGYAVMNARTAVTGACNAGKIDRYRDLSNQGCNVYKMWIATDDNRTRLEHQEAEEDYGTEAQAIPYDEYFMVGGEELMYPADPIGSGWNVCNCRCTMQTVVKFNSILSDEEREAAEIEVEDYEGEALAALIMARGKK